MIVQVTDTEKAEFMKNYRSYLDFLQGKIEWYELKNQLNTVLSYFIRINNYEKNKYSEEYFKQIENEYYQKKS